MKQLLILLLILLLIAYTQQSVAARIAHLMIYSREHTRFTVYLDGEQKNTRPKDSVRILNLSQAFYRLRIEFEDTTLEPIEKKVLQMTDASGYSVDAMYEIRRSKKGKMSLNFLSQTTWPVYIDPGKPEPLPFPGSITASIKKKEPGSKQKPAPPKTLPPPAPATADCKDSTLTDSDFREAIQAITSIKNDDSRMLTAKQVASSNCLTVNNVSGILRLFTTDEKKVEIAAYAYPRVVNRGVFFKIKEELKEEGSFEKLMRMVAK